MQYTREEACRAWLTHGLLRPEDATRMLREAGSAEKVYDRLMREGDGFLPRTVTGQSRFLLKEQAPAEKMHEMLLTMRRWNMRVLALDDPEYPDYLRQIPEPPALLMYAGDLSSLKRRRVTVVGSRNASVEGLAVTRAICKSLSNAGVTIVSGLAVGIDAAAHEGCLQGASPTIAIAATGIDVSYPIENQALKERILQNGGLILSEYPPGMRPSKFVFGVRNRIMAGLGEVVILMEARIKSGSMLTVHHALDQGKDVLAYPGTPGSPYAEGAHQLLREGAHYFTHAKDILEELGWSEAALARVTEEPVLSVPPVSREAKRPIPSSAAHGRDKAAAAHGRDKAAAAAPQAEPASEAKAQVDLSSLTDVQRTILNHLGTEPTSFDELTERTGIDAPVLMTELTMLQVLKAIIPMPGKSYCKAI